MGGLKDAKLNRFGLYTTPTWTHGTEATAPSANDTLVSVTVTSPNVGYIYGFFINCQEANEFLIGYTTGGNAKTKRITFGSQGTMISELSVPFNKGESADAGTAITIKVVSGGGVGKKYVASVLVGQSVR